MNTVIGMIREKRRLLQTQIAENARQLEKANQILDGLLKQQAGLEDEMTELETALGTLQAESARAKEAAKA